MATLSSLCVFCGSAAGTDPTHMAAGWALGAALASEGVQLVFGGGNVGIMGAVAQATLAGGGRVVGIIPGHLDEREIAHPNLTELLVVPDMHTRKRLMFERSDAFAVLPGGFGTLDETFEILTWRQLGLHDKPVIIADIKGFWQPMLAMSNSLLAGGFITQRSMELFTVVGEVADILPTARAELQESSAAATPGLF